MGHLILILTQYAIWLARAKKWTLTLIQTDIVSRYQGENSSGAPPKETCPRVREPVGVGFDL
jgi:hypothetical protein